MAKPKRSIDRAQAGAVRTTLIVMAALMALGGVLYGLDAQRDAEDPGLTVIAVEARTQAVDALDADVRAQLDEAATTRQEVLLTATRRSGNIGLHTSFSCDRRDTDLRCEAEQQEAMSDARRVVDQLVGSDDRAEVDPFVALRRTEHHLARHPVAGSVTVYLNLTGRLDVPGLDLSATGMVASADAVVEAAREADVLPDDCSDWDVHIILPATEDATYDRHRQAVFDALIGACGGVLRSIAERWVDDGLPAPAGVLPKRSAPVAEQLGEFALAEAMFDVGESTLRPGADHAVAEIADHIRALLETDAVVRVEVHGFADSQGPDTINEPLSRARAEEVAGHLRDRTDLPPDSLTTHGHGSIPDDGAEAAQRANRRVEVHVYSSSDAG